jgi:hypothetical protein
VTKGLPQTNYLAYVSDTGSYERFAMDKQSSLFYLSVSDLVLIIDSIFNLSVGDIGS